MRQLLLLCLFLLSCPVPAQDGGGTALSFSRTTSVPLNKVQLFDRATNAANATFGREPGAKVLLSDRDAGSIEVAARMNFRSAMLIGREETMGTISYTVHITVKPGELAVLVSGISHSGNSTTARGGISMGTLMRNDEDTPPTKGMGRTNAIRLHGELRTAAATRITALLQALEAHIRAHLEP